MPAPAFAGNTRHAYVVSTAAPTLPVTIDATHNDFKFNAVDYIIANAVYSTLQSLADAINASLAGGSTLFTTVGFVDISRSDPTKLRLTSVAAGAITFVFAAGASNDALAGGRIGFAAAQALAGGDPLD